MGQPTPTAARDRRTGALKSPKRKAGRKTKPHRHTRTGETIDGLYREPDGRWRITLPGPLFRERFTEPDEDFAIARFRRMTGQETPSSLVTLPPRPEVASAATEALSHAEGSAVPRIRGTPPGEVNRLVSLLNGIVVDEDMIWPWVAEQIRTRPKYVAERTRIEQIGYLTELKVPTVSPTLAQVGKLYHERNKKITDHWRTKSERYWSEFVDSIGGEGVKLRDVTQEQIAEYKAETLEAATSPTFVKHRFHQVKTITNYPAEWGKWLEDRQQIKGLLAILKPPSSLSLDPTPIGRSDFHKLFDAATAATNRLAIIRPVLLLSLNACLYGSEVADVEWSDLNLSDKTLVMDRGKTGVARVAVLWDRTVEALGSLKRIDGIKKVFLTEATR